MSRPYLYPNRASAPQVRIGVRRAELAQAFELVYASYLERGYINPHSGGLLYRKAFGLPSSRTLVALAPSGAVIGTMTVAGDSPVGLEVEATYPEEVDALRSEGRQLAEVTCLAIPTSSDSGHMAVFFELTRFMIQYAYWRGFDDLLMVVHPRHHRFYWRQFRVAPLGPCRPHGPVCGNPSVGCRIDLHTLKQNVVPEMRHKYFGDQIPKTLYLAPPISPEDHEYFLQRSAVGRQPLPAHRRPPRRDAA